MDWVTSFVTNPPSWILLIIVGILTAHVLSPILEKVDPRTMGPTSLLATLELVVTVVIAVLVLHQYFETAAVVPHTDVPWYEEPTAMLGLLIIVTFLSAVLFTALVILVRRLGGKDDGSS